MERMRATVADAPPPKASSAERVEAVERERASGESRIESRSVQKPGAEAGTSDASLSAKASQPPSPIQPGTELTVSLQEIDSRAIHVGDPVAGVIRFPSEFRFDTLTGRVESVTPGPPGSLRIVFTELKHNGEVIPIEGRVVKVDNDAVRVSRTRCETGAGTECSDGTILARENVHIAPETSVTVRIQH
jgi:hypothetical protein